MSGSATRQALVDAALRAFAEQGVENASLLEITRLAGQRNRGAVHYHFGSREGLLAAVLEEPTAAIAPRIRELLDRALDQPEDDVAAVLEAVARPVVETAESGWRGRCYLRILTEVALTERAAMPPAIRSMVESAGIFDVLDVLGRRLPAVAVSARSARFTDVARFVLGSAADRAKQVDAGLAAMPTEEYVANLVAMTTALVSTPADPSLV